MECLRPETTAFIFQMVFLFAASCFFVCLKLLSSPKTARLGNLIGAVAMFIAIIFTFAMERPTQFIPLMAAMALGSFVGVVSAKKVEMTAMPQMIAIFNGFGGLASVLVAIAEAVRLYFIAAHPSALFMATAWFSVAVGAITFTGSMVAYLKLQEIMPTRPILVRGQRAVTLLLSLLIIIGLFLLLGDSKDIVLFVGLSILSALLGIVLVIPIGGADMPVVISLLNSYSGLAALAVGFVVKNNLLIISGALVGASGIILTRLMCHAMNRSLFNVVFGAFGGVDIKKGDAEEKTAREFTPLDAAILLKNASRVIIVPGYGLAVSQAQRNLRELADELKSRGVTVAYAIHPVAGRMPGHMNVLLAEADIPYNELFDLDEINGEFETADVAIVIGANDVVNPAARSDKSSPLYGMPILNADKAKAVIVMKRGKGRGFAGVENPLFTLDQAGIVYGDAKMSVVKIILAIKEL